MIGENVGTQDLRVIAVEVKTPPVEGKRAGTLV
jgi:hypothetical protein